MDEFGQVAREIFRFMERVHGVPASHEGFVVRYRMGPICMDVYPRPALVRQGGVRFHVHLDQGMPYRFDLAELVWYQTTLSAGRDRLPPYVRRSGYDEGMLQVQAGRLRMYCGEVLQGDTGVFHELVKLRLAGGALDPRAERWTWVTSHPPLSPLDDAVDLPSPDGTLVVTLTDACEVQMSGPVMGTLRFSTGRRISGASPLMVWSADSKHLAFIRIQLKQRTTTLAVVSAATGRISQIRRDVGFPLLASFEDGVVQSVDGSRFDAREAIARMDAAQ